MKDVYLDVKIGVDTAVNEPSKVRVFLIGGIDVRFRSLLIGSDESSPFEYHQTRPPQLRQRHRRRRQRLRQQSRRGWVRSDKLLRCALLANSFRSKHEWAIPEKGDACVVQRGRHRAEVADGDSEERRPPPRGRSSGKAA